MPNLSLKQKIMIIIGVIGAILIAIFQHGLFPRSPLSLALSVSELLASRSERTPSLPAGKANPQPSSSVSELPTNNPELLSTNPSPLNDIVILPNQTIEFTFNLPLENAPEFKHQLIPAAKYKMELSGDRKTIKLVPDPVFQLGISYTLTIKSEAKFAGNRTLGKSYEYHFRTIEYKGV